MLHVNSELYKNKAQRGWLQPSGASTGCLSWGWGHLLLSGGARDALRHSTRLQQGLAASLKQQLWAGSRTGRYQTCACGPRSTARPRLFTLMEQGCMHPIWGLSSVFVQADRAWLWWDVPGSGAIAMGFGGGSCMWGNKLVDDDCLHRDLSFLSVSMCGLSTVWTPSSCVQSRWKGSKPHLGEIRPWLQALYLHQAFNANYC